MINYRDREQCCYGIYSEHRCPMAATYTDVCVKDFYWCEQHKHEEDLPIIMEKIK